MTAAGAPGSPRACLGLLAATLAFATGCIERAESRGEPAADATPDARPVDARPDALPPERGVPPDRGPSPPDAAPPDARVVGPCVDPVRVADALGRRGNAVRCADDSVDLVDDAPCAPIVDAPPCGGDMFGECAADTDCDRGPYGRCVVGTSGGGPACLCRYACTTHADCGEGRACLCAGAFDTSARCVRATCRGAADCPDGGCGLYTDYDLCGRIPSFACRTAEDDCRSDADCDPDASEDTCLPWREGDDGWGCDFPPPQPDPEPPACP